MCTAHAHSYLKSNARAFFVCYMRARAYLYISQVKCTCILLGYKYCTRALALFVFGICARCQIIRLDALRRDQNLWLSYGASIQNPIWLGAFPSFMGKHWRCRHIFDVVVVVVVAFAAVNVDVVRLDLGSSSIGNYYLRYNHEWKFNSITQILSNLKDENL